MPKIQFNHSDKLNNVLMMVMSGSTNAGKTHALFKMLTTPGILDYNNLQIFTNTPEQSYYQFLLHGFRNDLTKNDIYALWEVYENDDESDLVDIPKMCEEMARQVDRNNNQQITMSLENNKTNIKDPSELPKLKKNLVVFDDCVNDKDQILQKTFFTRGRHNNCACIYLTQSFYGLDGKDIRKNANVFLLFGMNQRSLTQIIQDVDVGDIEEFKRIARREWANPMEHKYVLVNIHKPYDERVITNLFI